MTYGGRESERAISRLANYRLAGLGLGLAALYVLVAEGQRRVLAVAALLTVLSVVTIVAMYRRRR